MGRIIEKARDLRTIIENLVYDLDDDEALEGIELFPMFQIGVPYVTGDRIRFEGVLYRVLQNHTSTAEWTPDVAPSLFSKVLPGQDGSDIGEWEQPDSTNPYMKGDKVRYDGKIWESIVDYNVWMPGAYGWIEVVDDG